MSRRAEMQAHRPQNELERRVYVILSRAYFGIHHVEGWERRESDAWTVSVAVRDGLDTYDGDTLTRLIIACHDECVRMEVRQGGPGRLRLHFSLRERRGYGLQDCPIMATHPTMERATEAARRYRWIVDVPAPTPQTGEGR